MAETVNLQVHDDMAFQNAVVEDQVGIEIVLVYKYALLSGFEAESAAHFKQELLKVVQNGGFQLCFREHILRL